MFSDSLSRIPSLLILGVLPTSFHTMHPEQNLLTVKYNFQLSLLNLTKLQYFLGRTLF